MYACARMSVCARACVMCLQYTIKYLNKADNDYTPVIKIIIL